MKIYTWVENGQLFTTEDKNLAPSDAIEFEVESLDDLTYDDSQIRLKTQDEKLQELKAQKAFTAKNLCDIIAFTN